MKTSVCPFCNHQAAVWTTYTKLWWCLNCDTKATNPAWRKTYNWDQFWISDEEGNPIAVNVGIDVAHGILRANPDAKWIRFGGLKDAVEIWNKKNQLLNN